MIDLQPMRSHAKFCNWLAAEMGKRNWQQRDLAARAGTNQQTVSRWLRGRSTPAGHHIRGLAGALGTSTDAILDLLADGPLAEQ